MILRVKSDKQHVLRNPVIRLLSVAVPRSVSALKSVVSFAPEQIKKLHRLHFPFQHKLDVS